MKSVWKLGATLLFNQFIADIACSMCILPFPMMFGKDNALTYILFLILDIVFFYYISYHGAYKVGFHDVSRHSSKEYDRSYIRRGIFAALLGAAPSLILLVVYAVGYFASIPVIQSALYIFRMWNLFAYWPLSNLIPNHIALNCSICLAVQMIFPFIGYICGCKGIVFSQKIRDAVQKLGAHK